MVMADENDVLEISVISPLGEDVLLFHSMSGEEELGRLFRYHIHVLSENHDVAPEDIVGHNVTVVLRLRDDTERYFNGYATVFAYVGSHLHYAHYQLTLEPWLGLLSRTVDCRIFQEKTVPDIAEEVFREYGFSDFELRLSGDYLKSEFCVQFEETMLDFLCRRFEHEGIYFYFLHEKDKHILILCDSLSSHDLVSEYEKIPFNPKNVGGKFEPSTINSWKIQTQLVPGTVTLNSYDFKSPRAKLLAKSSDPAKHPFAELEVFEFEDEYIQQKKGEAYAKIRREEHHAKRHVAEGLCNVRMLYCGALYEMIDHPRQSENKEYLIVSCRYELMVDEFFTAEERAAQEAWEPLTLDFTAIDSQTPYRPPRVTPVPKVEGPQTATVVGKVGEDIWTDVFGRIKVRFHWDRGSDGDEKSSCWIRVVQNRAGKGWGEVYLPHRDQEVVASFIGGDPDIPLITGRLYNGDNKPPLDLPADKTKVAMRDQGGNQVTMQGKGGEQQIALYSPTAESKISIGSPNESNVFIKTLGDLSKLVVGPEYQKTDGNYRRVLGAEVKMSVQGNASYEYRSDVLKTTVGSTNELFIGSKTATTISTEDKITLSSVKSFTGGVDQSIFVGAKMGLQAGFFGSVTGGWKLTVDESGELNKKAIEIKKVDGNLVTISGGPTAHKAGGGMSLTGNPMFINGLGKAEMMSGGAKILLSGGNVTITGATITLKGNVVIEKDLTVDQKSKIADKLTVKGDIHDG
jgi:type VI secretion system secreted protein VgrG